MVPEQSMPSRDRLNRSGVNFFLDKLSAASMSFYVWWVVVIIFSCEVEMDSVMACSSCFAANARGLIH